MKLAAGAILAGAGSRLLPPSIPFRFFGAAVVFHLLAWIALFAGADTAAQFAGGLGWPLAALHSVTLGVLAMTAIGASLQLLPVATRLPVGSERWPAAIWWLYTPGVAMTALGMGTAATMLLVAGAVAVVAALIAYAALLARNLLGAKGMPVVVAHGWAALGSLVLALATALALAASYVGMPTMDRATALALHVAFAAYGFMGMLALGLSYIVVPMFALAATPAARPAWASFALAVLGLLLAGAAALDLAPALLRTAAAAAGLAGVVLHLRLMTTALRTGMRRHLGRSFTLVRIAWAALVASLVVALAFVHDAPVEGIATLFGLMLIGGWLLTFLFAILQRIVPFLASMHAAQAKTRGSGRPLTPSALTAERPLAIHFACHLAALALLVIAIAADSALAVRAAAAIGAAGALAFGAFFAIAMRRMRPRGLRRPLAQCGRLDPHQWPGPSGQVISVSAYHNESPMSFQRQVSQALDQEHRANIDLLGRVELAFTRAGRVGVAHDADLGQLAGALVRQLEQDVGRHFDFEERELFPRLAAAGEGDIAALLTDEHEAIRAVAAEVLPLARAASSGTLDDAGWKALSRGTLELVERLVSHIQKETMALLPMLEDLLDEDSDRELAFAYASG